MTDRENMVAKLLRSLVSRIRAPGYLLPDESFWQSERRRSFRKKRRDERGVGARRP